jgi:hypothetical protein
VIDDTALPKKGTMSVGVLPQKLRPARQKGELPVAGVAHFGAG